VNRANLKFTGQKGMTSNSNPVLSNSCKHGKGKKHKGAKKGKAHNRAIAWLGVLGF
jgi:hypothetical protein